MLETFIDQAMLNSLGNSGFLEFESPRTTLAPQRTVTRNAALAEGKVALPHRFHMVDGRVIEGFLFRGVNSRLVDELYGQKGSFVSVVDAHCVTTGQMTPYMALNERHIVSIEELTELPPLHARPDAADDDREG